MIDTTYEDYRPNKIMIEIFNQYFSKMEWGIKR